ncbi:hypothetical protein FSW04_20220 [Baekduia soli]|uniref:LamG-like jellyroll fold domain-containing protein n=1 Tax=Baekduia soli TaxID=496014 RepID=A0A5B8UAI4_9ACTN|nr:LamG-like jellyroll fold domain-containing protein [Baekduia soli]QEC49672.1 hypothetical protein FSW04_20220 [Baekduia soli]
MSTTSRLTTSDRVATLEGSIRPGSPSPMGQWRWRCPAVRRAASIVLVLMVGLGAWNVSGAGAATVPLGARSFDAACTSAGSGDVITVPAGSYGAQYVGCTKAVTFQIDPSAQIALLDVHGASGPTFDGGTYIGTSADGAVSLTNTSNVTVRHARIHNMVYVEGTVDTTISANVIEPAPGGTTWSNGDMMDIYEQTRSPQSNLRLTIADNVFHGLRAPTPSSHSDALQFCNCGNVNQIPQQIKILRNRFYDNECMNIRTNDRDDVLIEQNVFGDTVTGISGCGYYSLDVLAADADVRYNTFPGRQKIQVNSAADTGQSQTWVGNAGVGMSTSCDAVRATYSHNVWTSQKCGSTDVQVASLKLNPDGSPLAGSPVVDAGDPSTFPAFDVMGDVRFAGRGPDAGAFEFGSTTTVPVDSSPAPTPSGPQPPGRTNGPSPPQGPGPAPGSGGSAAPLPSAGGGGVATPSGLVAAYGFDELKGTVITDTSGHGLDGHRHGGRRTASGRFGRAMTFDGHGAHVTIPDAPALRLSRRMTLEAWVRPTAAAGQRVILVKGLQGSMSYGLYASDGRRPGARLVTARHISRVRAQKGLARRAWSHVAITYDGAYLVLYVNGVRSGSTRTSGALLPGRGALRIGSGFRGTLDEIRIYRRALTQREVAGDMGRPVTG